MRYISDTLLLLALSLTMLISYHSIWGFVLFFPLLFIRLFAFAKEKNYRCFVVTALFVLYVLVPATPLLMVSSAIGRIPGIDSVFILANRPYGREFYHVFPITPFYAIVLAAWSLLLYLRVKEPYRFVIPELTFRGNGSPMPLYTEELNNKSHLS